MFYGSSTAEHISKDEKFNNTSTTEDKNNITISSSNTQKKEEDENDSIPETSALSADSSGYRMPYLFDFNGGELLYPTIEAVNFNTETSTTFSEKA